MENNPNLPSDDEAHRNQQQQRTRLEMRREANASRQRESRARRHACQSVEQEQQHQQLIAEQHRTALSHLSVSSAQFTKFFFTHLQKS